MTRRFQPPDETIASPHPGTPDDSVSLARRCGREAARRGEPDTTCPYPSTVSNSRRTDWMLGYYDVGLERFFQDETVTECMGK